jgi:hypothetical protein
MTDLEKVKTVIDLMARREALFKAPPADPVERDRQIIALRKALGAAQGALCGVGATVYVQQYREERAHTLASVITDGGEKFGVTTQVDCFMVTPGAEELIRWQPNDAAARVSWGHAEVRGEHIVMFPLQSKPEDRRTCDMLVIGYRSIRYEGRTA